MVNREIIRAGEGRKYLPQPFLCDIMGALGDSRRLVFPALQEAVSAERKMESKYEHI